MSFLEALAAEPWRFDWLATMRRLEREHPERPRIGESASRAQEFVALSQNPYLEFPASTIEAASKDENGRLRLVARFLGMFGPQGALPLTTTDEAYTWLRARDDARPAGRRREQCAVDRTARLGPPRVRARPAVLRSVLRACHRRP